MAIVLLLAHFASEDVPTPAVHDQREGQEGELVHRLRVQVVDIVCRVIYRALDESQGLKVARGGH